MCTLKCVNQKGKKICNTSIYIKKLVKELQIKPKKSRRYMGEKIKMNAENIEIENKRTIEKNIKATK